LIKNIKTRLIVYYFIAISILLSIFAFVVIYVFYSQSLKTISSQLLIVAQDIDHDIVDRYNNNFAKGFDEEGEFMIKNLIIKVIDKKQTPTIIASTNQQLTIESKTQLSKGGYQNYKIEKNGIKLLGVTYRSLFLKDVYLEIETTIKDKIDEPYERLIWTILIIFPVVLCVFLLIGYFVIQNSFRRVKNVINQVHKIEIENLSNRIETIESNDEISQLIDTFNLLLDRVDDGVNKIKRFSNDVSHELKTPLTVIRGELEVALRKDRDVSEYKDVLKTLLDETNSLQEMIDGLLFLSTKNKIELKSKFQMLEFDSVLLDVIGDAQKSAKSKGIEFEIEPIEEIELYGDVTLLKIMLNNIINNSIKYSHENSKIQISLQDNEFMIKDFGIGIKKDEINNIFDRFYRSDEARVRDGFGLGLSIVFSIVNLHNFQIEVESEFGKFTQVRILFHKKATP
jgi:signal transduction histidine kinase